MPMECVCTNICAADWVETNPTMNVWNQMTVKVYGFAILGNDKTHNVEYVKYVVHCLFILATQTKHTQMRLATFRYVSVFALPSAVSYDMKYVKILNIFAISKQATIFTATFYHLVNMKRVLNPLSGNTSTDKQHVAKQISVSFWITSTK